MILRGILLGLGALGVIGGVAHAASKSSEPATQPIAPPGVEQPPGKVALPPPPPMVDGDALHVAARAVLTALAGGATKNAVPAVRAFEIAYNATRPAVPLAVDAGKYGPKCQAVLQSIIAPARAPQNAFDGGNVPGLQPHPSAPKGSMSVGRITVAGPSTAAASPLPSDVKTAASVLAGLAYLPKTSDVRVATFQKAYNRTPGVLHLPEDGKYGGSVQSALQSVLNWMGDGRQAPANSFGMVAYVGLPPVYPPGAPTPQLHAALASQGLDIETGAAPTFT